MDPQQLINQEDFALRQLTCYLGMAHTDEARRESNLKGIDFLQHLEVLPNLNTRKVCPTCNLEMRTQRDRNRNLGFRYICRGVGREHKLEPTQNTFLQKARLKEFGADNMILLAYHWLLRTPVTTVMKEYRLSPETAVAWYGYFRDVANKIAWHEFQPIGGQGDVVEIDESHLFKRKYNVGKLLMWRNYWIFGGISRATKKRFAVLVDRRNADTLIPLAQQFIDSDSYICSDLWRAYGQLEELFRGHGRVNCSTHFISPSADEEPIWVPNDYFLQECLDRKWRGPPPNPDEVPFRIHINNYERSWRELKSILKSCTSVARAPAYIGEWMYRNNIMDTIDNGRDKFLRFWADVKKAYPGIGKNPMKDDILECDCHICIP